jgi:hypothetical protein
LHYMSFPILSEKVACFLAAPERCGADSPLYAGEAHLVLNWDCIRERVVPTWANEYPKSVHKGKN